MNRKQRRPNSSGLDSIAKQRKQGGLGRVSLIGSGMQRWIRHNALVYLLVGWVISDYWIGVLFGLVIGVLFGALCAQLVGVV